VGSLGGGNGNMYTLLHGTSPPPPLRCCTRDYYQSIGNIHQHVIIVVGARTVWHKVIGFIFIWGHFMNAPYLVHE